MGVGSLLISPRSFSPFFIHFSHADGLVLQRVGQFVGHDRLLLFHGHPVEQVDGFCFGIVVAGDFFSQERDEESLQIEIARKQAEFLQHQFRTAQALGVFVVHVLGEEGDDLVAAGQLAFHFMLDGQAGLLAVEFQNFIDGVEEFLGLAGSDFDFVFRAVLALRFA